MRDLWCGFCGKKGASMFFGLKVKMVSVWLVWVWSRCSARKGMFYGVMSLEGRARARVLVRFY